MAFAEYDRYDALGLAGLIAKKKISAREAVDEAIARAEKLNPKLNAIVFADYERARDTAKGKLPKGPFAGVPILLKDMRAGAKGMPTRNGSRYMPRSWPITIPLWWRAIARPALFRWVKPTCRN